MARPNALERRMSRFLREPPSVRNASAVIVTVTLLVVVGGGVLIRVLDRDEYASVWVGMWWAVQTVTTVGYGDVTPKAWEGRIVAAVVMLQGIAFVAIITAAITSTFVARATREHEASHGDGVPGIDHLDARFDDLERRLARIEAALARPRDAGS